MKRKTESSVGVEDRSTELPLDRATLGRLLESAKLDLATASIREVNRLVNAIEAELAVPFVRMEFGIPGLPLSPLAVEAEVAALRERQVGHVYAPFEGIPELKQETALFARSFMDVDVPPACCYPTVGAMEGCFASLAVAGRLHRERRTVLFLDPGFPVNRLQVRMLGLQRESIDFYDHRGEKLLRAVEQRARRGDLCAIIWSSPNNPTWIVLKDSELAGLGRICDEYDLLAIEDLAYFAMDVRQDYTRPGEPPYQPTVLRHTDRGISVISSSKMFSYAGQRIAMSVMSPALRELERPDLVPFYGTANVAHAFAHGVLYPLTACVPESTQHGLLALLRAANAGRPDLFEPAREYSRRAKRMKRLFLDSGFRLVYDNDLGEPLADGFYFTICHPDYDDGAALLRELLHFGVSAITLETAGSCRHEGLRACVSLIDDERFDMLERRLRRFREEHRSC